jgi:DNA topoisomerase-1
VIDILALRVGGEKNDDEADTVGCCSLRCEHIKLKQPGQGDLDIELEFLGKDSMLYKQTTDFAAYGDVGNLVRKRALVAKTTRKRNTHSQKATHKPTRTLWQPPPPPPPPPSFKRANLFLQVYNNFVGFCSGKKADEQVFSELSPPVLNKHLNELMPGLSAKVFRTYNASVTLQSELPTLQDLAECENAGQKVLMYNEANKKVAILCNHQRTVSAATEAGLGQLKDRLAVLKRQKKELGDLLKAVRAQSPRA